MLNGVKGTQLISKHTHTQAYVTIREKKNTTKTKNCK